MKVKEDVNPLPIKAENPNYEPWLNEYELIFEIQALQNGIHKMIGGL